MRCQQALSVLEATESARAPRPDALREHLGDCLACREHHPEMAWLLDARPARDHIRIPAFTPPIERWSQVGRMVAAATLLLAAGWIAMHLLPATPEPVRPVDEPSPVSRQENLGGDRGTIRNRIIRIRRSGRTEFAVTTRTWTPSPPRILRAQSQPR